MKVSEVMRVMHDKIQTLPADAIYMQYYRSIKHSGPCAFYSPTDCGSQGCLIGWAATTPELAPLPEEYSMLTGNAYHLDFVTYSLRILGITTHWSQFPMYNELFRCGPRDFPMNWEEQKTNLLHKLLVAEEALIKADEDPEKAWEFAVELRLGHPPYSSSTPFPL